MEDRQVFLHSGTVRHSVTIPDGVRFQYACLNPVKNTAPPAELIRHALDHPVDAPKIEELVRPGQTVCIISDDNTRSTPVPLILNQLLPRLEGAGVHREDIFIVMALGSHRRMTQREMAEKVGQQVFDRYRVLNSAFDDPDQLTQVGQSELGTPIRVFRPAMQADIRIGLGTVAPHGCMGWSGGAKILYPGITASDIVSEFHMMQGLRDEVLLGMVECPVRLSVEQWTKNIGLHYIINCVLDGQLQLYHVAAGDYVSAHRKAVSFAQEVCGIRLAQRPDVVLAAAYPLHLDFWQCGKAAYGPSRVIRPGGELLLLAQCGEGVGPHPDVLQYMSLGKGALQAQISAGNTGGELLAMAVGVSMGRVARHTNLTLLSNGITPQQCARAHMAHSPENALQQTLERALSRFDDPFLLVIPEGGEALPLLPGEA